MSVTVQQLIEALMEIDNPSQRIVVMSRDAEGSWFKALSTISEDDLFDVENDDAGTFDEMTSGYAEDDDLSHLASCITLWPE